MEEKLLASMKNAVLSIANTVDKEIHTPSIQETNIFKILKMENHEIRHCAFLEYLLDPDRNLELATDFLSTWLSYIVQDQGISDAELDKFIYDKKGTIGKIEGENRYTEIIAKGNSQSKKNDLRIDHALEIKLKGTCRVLVFEYKQNGVVNNDLKKYHKFIQNRYKNKKSKIYYFILELGTKSHTQGKEEIWKYLSRESFINALEDTLGLARRKDMMATSLYIEKYLEILQPDPEPHSMLFNLKSQLWDLWNPEVQKQDPEEKYFYELVEDYIESQEVKDALFEFDYHMLVDWSIYEATKKLRNGKVKVNSGWVRFIPNNCSKDIYLSSSLKQVNDTFYLCIRLESWQNPKSTLEESKNQYIELISALKKHSKVNTIIDNLNQLDQTLTLTIDDNDNQPIVMEEVKRPDNSRVRYKFSLSYLRKVDFDMLKDICVSKNKPRIFEETTNDLKRWVDILSGSE